MDTRRCKYDEERVWDFGAINSHRPWRGVASMASRGVAIICPCGAMDTRRRGYDERESVGVTGQNFLKH